MAAVITTMQQHPSYCASSAAACTSARFGIIMDTVFAAVSIILFLLMRLMKIFCIL